MDYAPRKISKPVDATVFEAGEKKVGFHHLDTNNHVNNGQYIRIAMQACDLVAKMEGLDDIKRLASGRSDIQIRAEYRQQAHLGDVIHPVVYGATDRNACTIFLNDDAGKPYSIVELTDKRS